MKLFKFKSLTNFEFISDILCNERFYASKFFELNDPMEGRFDHAPNTKKEFLAEILYGKQNLRICSFSKEFGNLLLWAHYADSFKGICFEVEARSSWDAELVEVRYSDFSVYVSDDSEADLETLPRTILSGKNQAWDYEKEFRLLSRNEYIHEGVRIRAIYLGLRTPDVMKNAICRLAHKDIPVFETELCRSSNSIKRGRNLRVPKTRKR